MKKLTPHFAVERFADDLLLLAIRAARSPRERTDLSFPEQLIANDAFVSTLISVLRGYGMPEAAHELAFATGKKHLAEGTRVARYQPDEVARAAFDAFLSQSPASHR